MVTELSITVKPEEENSEKAVKNYILKSLAARNIRASFDEITPVFIKKSIDARHGQIKIVMRFEVYIG